MHTNQPSGGTLAFKERMVAILGGSAGNLIEWYDWFAYAAFSLYFAKTFFPKGDQTAQLLQTAAIFAVGFLARPIGAWILGRYADRRGRRAGLTVSVAMMCLGSLMMALIPGYGRIGVAAPIGLTLARLVQGLSIGGEYGASATYMSEMAGRARRGFWSSFQFVTIIAGQLAALGVLIVLQQWLTPAELDAFGWRIPFVIGALLAVVVFWIQTGLNETDSFRLRAAEEAPASGVWRLISGHPKETAMIFTFTAGGSLAFYCFTTYMQKFLTNTAHFSRAAATEISAASLLVFLAIQPVLGWASDKLGRKAMLVAGFGLGALTTWPLMTAIGQAKQAGGALILVCAALAILTGYTAVSAVVKSELFPTGVRALGVALPYAAANAVFGGTAEYIALAFKQAGRESAFYIYVSLVLSLACIVALRMRDTQKASLIAEN